jgi:predicted nuclease with TOPRIM domain
VVLKLQETLRDTQKRLQVSKVDHATDVQKADRFEQEATDAKCALMAMQQDLSKLQEQFKVLEQEKEALKKNLKEEEVARIAAQGQIALPSAQEDDEDLFNSPRKSPFPRKVQSSSFSENGGYQETPGRSRC